ncbi:MAG: hypothetical protein U0M12_03335 [Acutalibacteraceae bacterium]|nr:hypothetical protein [Acutalibacteraceae bacterium]
MSVFPWSMSDFKPGDRRYVYYRFVFYGTLRVAVCKNTAWTLFDYYPG